MLDAADFCIGGNTLMTYAGDISLLGNNLVVLGQTRVIRFAIQQNITLLSLQTLGSLMQLFLSYSWVCPILGHPFLFGPPDPSPRLLLHSETHDTGLLDFSSNSLTGDVSHSSLRSPVNAAT